MNNEHVWLKIPGGVECWKVSELNKYIRKYNTSIAPFVKENCFFDYLSYETGETYYRIWEYNGSKLLSIKSVQS